MFGPNVADKYALAATKNLGLGCNSWPCSAGHFFLSSICPQWPKTTLILYSVLKIEQTAGLYSKDFGLGNL